MFNTITNIFKLTNPSSLDTIINEEKWSKESLKDAFNLIEQDIASLNKKIKLRKKFIDVIKENAINKNYASNTFVKTIKVSAYSWDKYLFTFKD